MEKHTVIPTAEEIARLKGQGFLRDKTTPDAFNARVITVNGKVSAKTLETVAEAARRFGSGEVALTVRQTFEVQRIPYSNVEPFLAFLAEHGLETGGTGPRVRPIVSCKGTTCQYGLIDTFALSEEIHRRFYKGYRSVKLPHKFKIGVGGCPHKTCLIAMENFVSYLDNEFDYSRAVEMIMRQKYVATVWVGVECWADYRRTGYPVLKTNGETAQNKQILPTRMRYPSTEAFQNAKWYDEAVNGWLGGENNMTTDVWWASTAESQSIRLLGRK